jgi:hypothetical protein
LARDFDGIGRAAFARRDDEDGFARREARDEYGVPVADFGRRGLRINDRCGDYLLVEENSVRGAYGGLDSLCVPAAAVSDRVARGREHLCERTARDDASDDGSGERRAFGR